MKQAKKKLNYVYVIVSLVSKAKYRIVLNWPFSEDCVLRKMHADVCVGVRNILYRNNNLLLFGLVAQLVGWIKCVCVEFDSWKTETITESAGYLPVKHVSPPFLEHWIIMDIVEICKWNYIHWPLTWRSFSLYISCAQAHSPHIILCVQPNAA